jgi:putative PIN family toxin of toxin-antitoxin system
MRRPRVVIDTNVVVAASRSRHGASAKLLSFVGTGRFEIVISVALVIEYEYAVPREVPLRSKKRRILEDILDYLCAVGQRQEVFFLWRPQLRDPEDDMVLELAVAGRGDAIVTFNRRDFGNLDRFGLEVLSPGQFLARIGELS